MNIFVNNCIGMLLIRSIHVGTLIKQQVPHPAECLIDT